MHRLGHEWFLAGRRLRVGMITANVYGALTVYEALHPRAYVLSQVQESVVTLPFREETEVPRAKVTQNVTSLVVQWLGLCDSTAGGTGLIPGWATKILQAT